jgi:CRP-like cAMP-binding protein
VKEKLLAHTPLFKSLPEEEIIKLTKTLRVREVPPNTILFKEGQSIGDTGRKVDRLAWSRRICW